VAAFYGVNPFQLTDFEFLGLLGNIPRLKARRDREKLMAQPGVRIKGEDLYDLLKAEGIDEASVQKHVKDYMFKRAIDGEPIE